MLRHEAFHDDVQERGEHGTAEEAGGARLRPDPAQPAAERRGDRRLDRGRRTTEQTAAWDVSAVPSTVADAAGDDLLGRILLQLPADSSAAAPSPPDHD